MARRRSKGKKNDLRQVITSIKRLLKKYDVVITNHCTRITNLENQQNETNQQLDMQYRYIEKLREDVESQCQIVRSLHRRLDLELPQSNWED